MYVNAFYSSARGQWVYHSAMKRVDDHIHAYGALMKRLSLQGPPMQEPDGTWEVRVLQAAMLPFVKHVLQQHYSLQIVRESDA